MKPKLPQQIFITGIGTGVGKTLSSAVLCEALQADYWKPVQSGNLENSDTQVVQSLVSNPSSKFYTETYKLKEAASPHFAARKENVVIEIEKFKLPDTNNRLIIEGAGGIMVPLNNDLVMFDLIDYLRLPTIVVIRNYLGSINHALLTLEFLEGQGIEIPGIIISGENYNDNEEIIQHFTALPIVGRIDETKTINKDFVSAQAEKMKLSLSLNFQL